MLVMMFIVLFFLLLLLIRVVAGKQLRYMILDRTGATICRIRGRHQRSRRRVKKIGDTFMSRCRICDVTLEKKSRDDDWVARPPAIPAPKQRTSDPEETDEFWDEDELEPRGRDIPAHR